jgi:hypothetical protein
MKGHTDDQGETALAQMDGPGASSLSLVGEKSYLSGLMAAAYLAGLMAAASLPGPTGATPSRVDDIYGWCGLCHCFTEFPHECAGDDRPAGERAA